MILFPHNLKAPFLVEKRMARGFLDRHIQPDYIVFLLPGNLDGMLHRTGADPMSNSNFYRVDTDQFDWVLTGNAIRASPLLSGQTYCLILDFGDKEGGCWILQFAELDFWAE